MEGNPLLRFYIDNKKHLPGLLVIVGISLLSGVLKMLSATYWGKAVDFGVAGLVEEMIFSAVFMAVFILLDCARTAFHYHVIGRITETMFLEVRGRAFEKVTRGDAAVLEEKFRTGDIAARLNNDIDLLSTFSAGHLSHFSRQIFSGIFGLISCIFISWQLSLAYLIILPLSLGLVNAISKPIQAQTKKSMDHTGSAMSCAADAISGALTLKAFSGEQEMENRFGKAADAAYDQAVRSEKITMKMTGVRYLANVIQTMSLFLIGSFLVSSGRLSVGMFIAFVTMSNYITEAFSQSDYVIRTVRNTIASARRYYEVIDIPDEQRGGVKKAAAEEPCTAEKLDFSYAPGGKQVLRGLTLRIPENKRVAIVGASGCGKSTLLKLICRFYFPDRGSLRLFGVETEDWEPDALRENMAIVTQEPRLFDGSIFENLSYGRPGVTREECEAVLRDVSLWDFVSSFPEGMDHPIGEGGLTLSGGQKQRLCIARAMVKQAKLVLLDEATSALDLQTEREVQASLEKLLEGRAAVIIAHRLSTVQNADYIYCMEQGEVIEEGTPGELLQKKGRYYKMCRLQGLVKREEEGEA